MAVMKKLYSSTFLSVILGFLMVINQSDHAIEIKPAEEKMVFRSIVERNDLTLPSDGKLHVDVFSAFTCSGCRAFGLGTLKPLYEGSKTKENEVFTLHLTPNKEDETDLLATKAALCAGGQEKFWDMLGKLYEMEAITKEEIDLKTEELELNQEAFNACLEDDAITTEIDESLTKKEAMSIKTLPSTLVNTTELMGAQPLENVEREIRKQL